MRRFSFRLQSILDLRGKQADQLRLELGVIAQRCGQLQRDIDDRLERRRLLLRDSLAGGIDLVARSTVTSYAERLLQEAGHLRDELARAEQEREQAAAAYRAARQKAEVLERLRDKRAADHRESELRREQRQMDDIAQHRAGQAIEGGI